MQRHAFAPLIAALFALAMWTGCDQQPPANTGNSKPKPATPIPSANANATAPKSATPEANKTSAAPTVPPAGEATFKLAPGQSTSFAAVARHLDAGGSFYLYVSPDQVFNWVDRGFDAVGRLLDAKPFDMSDSDAATGKLALRITRAAFVQSGVRDIDGLGASTIDLGGGITRNVQMLHHPAAANSGLLWNVFGKRPHALDALNLMPADTAWAAHGDLDIANATAWFKAFVVQQAPPEVAKSVDGFWELANQSVGLDKLLASYGGEGGVYITLDANKTIEIDAGALGPLGLGGVIEQSLPPIEVPADPLPVKPPQIPTPPKPTTPPPPTKATSSIQVQPATSAPKVVDVIRPVRPTAPAAVAKKIKIPEPGLVVVIKARDNALLDLITKQVAELKIPGKEVTADGVKMTVYAVPVEALPMALTPTLYQANGYLVLASTEALARKVLAVQQGKAKGLRDTAEFQRLTRGLDLQGNQFQFLSQRFGEQYTQMMRQMMEVEDSFDMPPFMKEWMLKFMTMGMSSTVSVMQVLPEGFWGVSHTTGIRQESALLAAGAVIPVAIMAGFALPALQKAREAANRVKNLNDAKQLGIALIQHAFDNGNKLPAANQWCDAVSKTTGGATLFAAPAGGPAGGKQSSFALNAALIGADINKADEQTVLLFGANLGWNGAGGLKEAQEYMELAAVPQITIVFVDGSARTCAEHELQTLRWKP
ncbi:MAG: hypothetical protein EXS22_10715 [Pedosphaera sp.]|nr:hypothetical protein [Pedosphaera sp.]MSU44484.1 hypothetical protein [Pedosphaera sp.]